MKLTVQKSELSGDIAVSGSKSHTIRGIVAALCAQGTSYLRDPLVSEDTLAALSAAELLGAKVVRHPDFWEITGTCGRFTDPGTCIDTLQTLLIAVYTGYHYSHSPFVYFAALPTLRLIFSSEYLIPLPS